jgi:hypothetical protein
MSDHSVKVIRIEALEPHPNADTLSIVRIGGFQVLVRTSLPALSLPTLSPTLWFPLIARNLPFWQNRAKAPEWSASE